jgi:hypothetical protein
VHLECAVLIYSVEACIFLLSEVTSANFSITWVAPLQEIFATYNDSDGHVVAQTDRHCVCILLDNLQHYPEQVCLPNRRLPYKDALSGETTLSGDGKCSRYKRASCLYEQVNSTDPSWISSNTCVFIVKFEDASIILIVVFPCISTSMKIFLSNKCTIY